MPITVGVGNIISEEGYSLLMSPAAAESVWKALLGHGAIPVGSNAWETLYILVWPFGRNSRMMVLWTSAGW